MLVISDKGICTTHSQLQWACLDIWVAACHQHLSCHYQKQDTISMTVSITLHLLCIPLPSGSEFPLVWYSSHANTGLHCQMSKLPVGMPPLNWLYGDTSCLWCHLLVVWWQRWFTYACGTLKPTVCLWYLTWDMLLPYFFETYLYIMTSQIFMCDFWVWFWLMTIHFKVLVI